MDYDELYDKYEPEADKLYLEWEKGRPCTPSDFPDENQAFVAGYLAACEKFVNEQERLRRLRISSFVEGNIF